MQNSTDNSIDRRGDDRLGDALQAAVAADIAAGERVPVRRRRTWRTPRMKLAAGLIAAALAVPAVAVAFAAGAFTTSDEVAQSIPNGTLALLGTEPTCTTVREGAEFDCRLAKAPVGELEPGAWQGTVEPTVDATKHVNGGCRALNGAGTEWRCYVGTEAVRQMIIGASVLGEYAPEPGVG